jgi:ferrochelatase
MPHSPPHLVLVNLGTPTAPTAGAVHAFLHEFLSDPEVVDYPAWLWRPVLRAMVLRTRPARVAELYASIWEDEGSPLRVETERLATGLRAAARGRFGVSTAYRYGEPSLETVLARLAQEEHGRIVVVPLFPQRTGATTGTAFDAARRAAARTGVAHRLEERCIQPDAPGYVEAMVARWQEALAGAPHAPEHLVVSFHGIPARYDRRERGLYVRDCTATMRAFLDAADWPAERATLAWQSKFGPEPWLTPATSDLLERLPARGVRHVAVLTPGFVTDGLETLEEIGIRGEETFRHAGGASFLRVDAVGHHPAFVATLAALANDSAIAPPARAEAPLVTRVLA